MSQQPNWGLDRLIVEVSRSHTIRHTHTLGRTPLNEWSARRRGRYLHHTQQTQEANNHGLSGIRTRNPTNRVAADLRLRPKGQPTSCYLAIFKVLTAVMLYDASVIWCEAVSFVGLNTPILLCILFSDTIDIRLAILRVTDNTSGEVILLYVLILRFETGGSAQASKVRGVIPHNFAHYVCRNHFSIEICALLGYYAASCGNCLPTFRDNVSVPSSRVKSPSRTDTSQNVGGGNLKSRLHFSIIIVRRFLQHLLDADLKLDSCLDAKQLKKFFFPHHASECSVHPCILPLPTISKRSKFLSTSRRNSLHYPLPSSINTDVLNIF